MLRASLIGWVLMIGLAACASAPDPAPPRNPALPSTDPIVSTPPNVVQAEYEVLPGWGGSSIWAGYLAFMQSCEVIAAKPPNEPLSPTTEWAGLASEWQAVCAGLKHVRNQTSAQAIMEGLFTPVEITDPAGGAKFTGYFEPMIEASHRQSAEFSAAIPGPPLDMVQSDDGPRQRLRNGQTRPYPPRADITPTNILGYAHPADVFFLQIQGSGRLRFQDGSEVRAAYHAHNGQPFKSTANWLLERGEITRGEASMQGIRAWMDRAPAARVVEAMNANPRYVFFEEKPIGDRATGPVGAQAVPLTALGSMAVDRDYHALGVPFWVETSAPGLGGRWSGLLVAQDTGGAIKGPVRGDIFFGTGPEAGERAGTMNAPGRKWALIPKAAAERLRRELGT